MLIRTLRENGQTLSSFLERLEEAVKTRHSGISGDKERMEFQTLFLSMIRQNGGRYVCPFNPWYFSVTEKQASFLKNRLNRWVESKDRYQSESSVFMVFPQEANPVELQIYNPNGKNKTYIGILLKN